MRRRKPQRADAECPHCGARFRAGRLACPDCGSDAETGWRDAEDIDYRSVEIPDTYEELTGTARRPNQGVSWVWIAAILALVAMLIPLVLSVLSVL